MKILNEIKFTVPADSRNEGLSRVVVSAFAAQLDPSVSEVGEIKDRRFRGGNELYSPCLQGNFLRQKQDRNNRPRSRGQYALYKDTGQRLRYS